MTVHGRENFSLTKPPLPDKKPRTTTKKNLLKFSQKLHQLDLQLRQKDRSVVRTQG